MNPEQLKMMVYAMMSQGGQGQAQQFQQAPQQANVLDPVRQQLAQLMAQTRKSTLGIPGLGSQQQQPQAKQGAQNMTVPLMPQRQQMSGSPFQQQALQNQNWQTHMRAQSQQSAGY